MPSQSPATGRKPVFVWRQQSNGHLEVIRNAVLPDAPHLTVYFHRSDQAYLLRTTWAEAEEGAAGEDGA
jgi:hypothetical protein